MLSDGGTILQPSGQESVYLTGHHHQNPMGWFPHATNVDISAGLFPPVDLFEWWIEPTNMSSCMRGLCELTRSSRLSPQLIDEPSSAAAVSLALSRLIFPIEL